MFLYPLNLRRTDSLVLYHQKCMTSNHSTLNLYIILQDDPQIQHCLGSALPPAGKISVEVSYNTSAWQGAFGKNNSPQKSQTLQMRFSLSRVQQRLSLLSHQLFLSPLNQTCICHTIL